MGMLSAELATDKCAISHQVNVGLEGEGLQVIADAYQLPFAAKSVDACLLAHTLSYADDPHRMLREVDRVLIDDGWLVISSFNPCSLLGLGKLVPGLRHRQPYVSRMFTQMRLLDWLSLLNYEVLHRARFHVLPWHRQWRKILCTHLPALGCMSVIVARKRTLPLTPTPMKLGRENCLSAARWARPRATANCLRLPVGNRRLPASACRPLRAPARHNVRSPGGRRGP